MTRAFKFKRNISQVTVIKSWSYQKFKLLGSLSNQKLELSKFRITGKFDFSRFVHPKKNQRELLNQIIWVMELTRVDYLWPLKHYLFTSHQGIIKNWQIFEMKKSRVIIDLDTPKKILMALLDIMQKGW